ncbi:MAG: DUF4446 family protein [Candidatus Doudnabacteria bacterium]
MNLNYINFGLAVILLLLVAWQFVKLNKLDRMRKEFFASGLKKDLEQILIDQNRSLTKIGQELKELDDSLTRLYKDNRSNIQKIGFMRFNPFEDAGGNISFVLTMLDAADNGIIISSLHGREGTRIYAKSVKGGLSESQLTEEEKEAIKNAD